MGSGEKCVNVNMDIYLEVGPFKIEGDIRARVTVGDKDGSYDEQNSDVGTISSLDLEEERDFYEIRLADIKNKLMKGANDRIIKVTLLSAALQENLMFFYCIDESITQKFGSTIVSS